MLADVIFAWYTEVPCRFLLEGSGELKCWKYTRPSTGRGQHFSSIPRVIASPTRAPSSGLFGILAARCPLPTRRTRNGARERAPFFSLGSSRSRTRQRPRKRTRTRGSVRAKIVGRALAVVPLRGHADSRGARVSENL